MFDAATRLVLTAGLVYSYRFPFSTSVILDEGRIAWIGDDGGLSGQLLDSDVVVDCEGALITPMFFDAMLASTADADASVGAGLVSTDSGPQLHRRSADGQWAVEPDHRDLAAIGGRNRLRQDPPQHWRRRPRCSQALHQRTSG